MLAAGANVTCTYTNTLPAPPAGQTAWAANGNEPGSLRFNPGTTGNWATYVAYAGVQKTVNLYAGQTQLAGTVTFSAPAGGMVTITITLAAGWSYENGSVVAVQDYASAPSGNPSPGQFAHKGAAVAPFSISVPQNSFYAVHAVVQN